MENNRSMAWIAISGCIAGNLPRYLPRIITLAVYLVGSGFAMAQPTPPIYGPPFYDNDTFYNDGSSSTVLQQVENDWNHYSQYWGVSPYGSLNCSFVFTPDPDGPTTGRFGAVRWTGECTGGDTIFGTRLEHPTTVTITPSLPPEIPFDSRVINGRVLTSVGLLLKLAKNGQPASGLSVVLTSTREDKDHIVNPGPSDDAGISDATVDTRDQPGTSTITSAYADIQTVQPGVIHWLPARYHEKFQITCYVVSLEANYLSTPLVSAPGIPGQKYHQGFLRDIDMQGTGLALDGTYVHWKGHGQYEPESCPRTASGTCAIVGATVAVDPSVIPLESKINIDGIGSRAAQDIGGGINAYHIDNFYGTDRHSCLQWGNQHHRGVELLDYGS
jgi:3D (Asp-Asp-Asp) domain-containing protein